MSYIKEGIETPTKPFKNPIVIDLTDNGNVGQIRIEAEDESLAREVDALATEAYENSLDDFDAEDLAGYEYFDKIATEKGLNFEPVFDDDIDDEYIDQIKDKALNESEDSDTEPVWLVQYYEGQGTDEHIKGFDAFYDYVNIAEEGIKIQNIWPDTGNEQLDSKLPCWTEEEGLLDGDDHDYYDDFYSDFDDVDEEKEGDDIFIDDTDELLKEYYNQENDYPQETFTPEEQEEYGIDEEGIDEAGDQWIHCEWCKDVVPVSDCRRELNLGWICDRCQDALWSRGEKAAYYEAKDIKKFAKAEKELNEGIIFSDKAIRCQVKDLLNDPLGKLILSRLQAGREGNGPYRLSDEELEILKDEYIYYEDDGDCYYARFEKPTAEIRKILNLSPQSDNPFLVHEYYNIANGSDSIIEEYALKEWETAGADSDLTDFPEEVLEKFIQILDRDYIWDLANEMVGWTCYDEDSDEELKEAANAILAYYKNDGKDFCDLLTRIDNEYRAKDYDENLNDTIKKIYYYIQGEGDDFEEYMLPLLACYYYDKPGKYKIEFSNRQFGSEYKALVEIIGNGTFRIIKRD